jgi:hypothetical protein
MNNDDYLEVIRLLINRETALQNNRLTWFLTSQSLLVAACGVFWDKNPYALAVVLFLGLSSAAATIPGLLLCTLAIHFYRTKAAEKIDKETDPPVDYDHAKEKKDSWWMILLPWRSLPWVFFFGWIVIGVAKLASR